VSSRPASTLCQSMHDWHSAVSATPAAACWQAQSLCPRALHAPCSVLVFNPYHKLLLYGDKAATQSAHCALHAHFLCCVQVCSAYHYLLLYGDRLSAINQVSGKIVSEVSWGPGSHTPGIFGECGCSCKGRGDINRRVITCCECSS
jgi:hypothetical protein